MLNKIKLVGKVLPLEVKEKEEERELIVFFSLMVPNPNCSTTILRCLVQGETAKKLLQELQEGDIAEVWGYLRNEKRGKSYPPSAFASVSDKHTFDEEDQNRQILTKVIQFNKVDLTFDELKKQAEERKVNSNEVRLVGKIITDFKNLERRNPELLSFKIIVMRERNLFPLFFCRIQEKELITEFNQRVNKGDIVLIEGFLQTVKNVEKAEERKDGEAEKKVSRNSAIIC
jgi:hypothetical protein